METASRGRWIISLLAIAGALPYIGLKVLWLSGSRVGLNDSDFGTSSVMQVANFLTMGMDTVAVLMALAFVTGWGQRIRARLVLFPMWIGTGFLAPILVIVPLQLAAGTTSTESAARAAPIAEWVYAMVYGGFMWQGLFLLTGFVLYSRHRWGASLGWRLRTPGRMVTWEELPRLLVVFGLLLAGGLALTSHVTGVLRPQAVNVVG
ncbi:MAG: hypothetical protein L0H93_07370, partial [Nocardioides sp.]|nr:hypothetical protein [Nocardioides sp.]